MSKKILISGFVILQFLLFFLLYLIQSSSGIPLVSLLPRLINLEISESLNPLIYVNNNVGLLLFELIYPLLFIGLYYALNRFDSAIQKLPVFVFYWMFWINVIILSLFAIFTRAYLGFIIIICYAGLIDLFTRSLKRTQNQMSRISYGKLYVHYFLLNILFVLAHIGVYAAFYM